jgi:arylsulfatase A-like enzyme
MPAARATQPNIILIMADDMNAAEADFMPVLQAEIAAQGVTFDNYFVVS